jgi:hypothetical protein
VNSVRGRKSGFFIALLSCTAVICLAMLAACDLGSPAPGATPTPLAEASALAEPGDIGDLLTEVPNLPTSTPQPRLTGITDADAAGIYVKVVDGLLGEKLPAYVYISPFVGEGERLDDTNTSQPLPDGLLPALQNASTGPHYALLNFEDAIGPLDEGGVVMNNGAFITLGAITADTADSEAGVVRGSIYRKTGDAQGMLFHLKRDPSLPGGWEVIDSTQEWNQ